MTRRRAIVVSVATVGLLAAALVVAVSQSTSRGASARPSGMQALGPVGGTAAAPPATASRSAAPTDSGPVVLTGIFQGLSPAVRDLPPPPEPPAGVIVRDIELLNQNRQAAPKPDPEVQRTFGPDAPPSPILTFDGVNNMCSCLPPDTNGEVGPNHYLQMVNLHFAVYSKLGALLQAPRATNQLWAGAGGECQAHNDGDPIVLYDQLADRWLLSQFIFADAGEQFGQCIAISQTPDPTGAYYRYEFLFGTTTFHDYPKLGAWPDAYYMTTNEFDSGPTGQTSRGAGVFAFERDKMLAGQPSPKVVFFDLGPQNPGGPNSPVDQFVGQEPADLDGLTLPPIGSPGIIVEVDDETNIPSAGGVTGDAMRIWKFKVDWATPANSTLGIAAEGRQNQPNFTLPVNEFVQPVCVFGNGPPNHCNPQKNTAFMLDTLGDRIMFRVAYRNFGDHQAITVDHTVSAADPPPATTARNAIRWYEVRNPHGSGGPPAIFQQSTFAPTDPPTNPLWRWMPSAAMDRKGNLAIGYSSSGPNDFPALRYAGRLVTDPPNQFGQGEAVLFQGLNSQAFPVGRWGDYSDMTVDPVDDCTFWYTSEYYGGSGIPIVVTAWRTRIGAFKFATCSGPTAVDVRTFATRRTKAGVQISWRTGTETEILGFNVWRSSGKSLRKLNRALLPARDSGRAAGASYRLVDSRAKGRGVYTYRLQVVDLKGKRSWYGAGSVPVR